MVTEIQAIAPKLPTPFLRDFFAEKEIPEKTFEVEGDFGVNFISNAVVVEHMAGVSADEAEQIEGVLRKIDFHNGDVNHFLAHLAKALAI